MSQVLLVAAGGAIGSVARYAIGLAAVRWFGVHFPWGTLAVNVIGGIAIGVLAARGLSSGTQVWLFFGTGVLGGFTTFSTFSLETLRLMDQSPLLAGLYVAASVLLALGACWVGLSLGRG